MVSVWIILILYFGWVTLITMQMFIEPEYLTRLKEINPNIEYMLSGYQFLEGVLFGFIFGTAFTLINYAADNSSIRKLSFGKIILFKSLFYFLTLVVASIIIYITFKAAGIIPRGITYDTYTKQMPNEFMIASLIFLAFFIILNNFMIQVNKKFGPGSLLKMLTGKYHKPVDEERVFMFIDMKDSTTIAEHLGHNEYSRLLQTCYHDLTEVVINTKAEIYQYVGDEVVLSWQGKEGFNKLNCIQAFFQFQKIIKKRKNYYIKNFEVVPEFKAGIDVGDVTAAEIGEIKRDVAFHGDVVNTASRIQENCKPLRQKLIISENVEKNIQHFNGFTKENLGEFMLRGREHPIKLYGIKERENN